MKTNSILFGLVCILSTFLISSFIHEGKSAKGEKRFMTLIVKASKTSREQDIMVSRSDDEYKHVDLTGSKNVQSMGDLKKALNLLESYVASGWEIRNQQFEATSSTAYIYFFLEKEN